MIEKSRKREKEKASVYIFFLEKPELKIFFYKTTHLFDEMWSYPTTQWLILAKELQGQGVPIYVSKASQLFPDNFFWWK